MIHFLVDKIIHKSQYTLYFEIFLKTLDALYYGTEGVYFFHARELMRVALVENRGLVQSQKGH